MPFAGLQGGNRCGMCGRILAGEVEWEQAFNLGDCGCLGPEAFDGRGAFLVVCQQGVYWNYRYITAAKGSNKGGIGPM